MTGEEVLDILADAREDGDYVLITPDGRVMSGPIAPLANVAMQLAMLEQLPTEGMMQ